MAWWCYSEDLFSNLVFHRTGIVLLRFVFKIMDCFKLLCTVSSHLIIFSTRNVQLSESLLKVTYSNLLFQLKWKPMFYHVFNYRHEHCMVIGLNKFVYNNRFVYIFTLKHFSYFREAFQWRSFTRCVGRNVSDNKIFNSVKVTCFCMSLFGSHILLL